MISKEEILQKISEIEKEITSLKAEVKKSVNDGNNVSLMDKYSHLPDVDEKAIFAAKTIWGQGNIKEI